jgi:Zn-finger nucleic acid-binding protein/DNA-directed RNA polymerase subunit RPC12/RpoP
LSTQRFEAMNCPNCSAEMDRLEMGGIYGADVELDLCFACHVLWLDNKESIQLSPKGTMDLFGVLHEHRDDPRHSLGNKLTCRRCKRRLSLNHDIGKAGRFSYYACPQKHGRLTPFSEFLKEKQFVRELSAMEQNRVRAELKHVQCSSCGAPVDLMKSFQCGHCGSPIAVLDADAVQKTLAQLEEADARRSGDPEAKEKRVRALVAMENLRATPENLWKHGPRVPVRSGDTGMDLLTASISALVSRLL